MIADLADQSVSGPLVSAGLPDSSCVSVRRERLQPVSSLAFLASLACVTLAAPVSTALNGSGMARGYFFPAAFAPPAFGRFAPYFERP